MDELLPWLAGGAVVVAVAIAVATRGPSSSPRSSSPRSSAQPRARGPLPADEELQRHLRDGQKIQAIKRYRELSGLGLKEAKDDVDAWMAEGTALGQAARVVDAAAPAGDPRSDPELLGYVRDGQKIQAIKRYRELTGSSLKDAKDAVDAMEG